MRVLRSRPGKSQLSFILLLLVVLATVGHVSAQGKDANTSATTDAAQTTTADPSSSTSTESLSSGTTSSTKTSASTASSSSSSSSQSTMDSSTTTSSSSSTSTDSTSTSSVSTTTGSTSSSSSTSTSGPVVAVPPTENAPYMQESNIPEGTVFIAVGAILALIGLAVLAWRALVAWSVNRSVRRAALAQSSEKKRLSRRNGGGRKRSHGVYTAAAGSAAAAGNDVSLDKLGTSTRTTYKSTKRVPSSSSGLFFSPTAGGTGSHHSLPNAGNRASTYLPAGYYAAAGVSTPSREHHDSQPHIYSPTGAGGPVSPGGGYFAGSSPSLPPVGGYTDAPPNRHSYMAASSSSLNLNQPPQGRAPSAYLEDLFESHTSPRGSQSGFDRH
ncbi:hypothetical protein POX_c04291 [Penicillium oxalicum]|uniref:Uncharacterized protein n=1 Tax=Penicillium oxalicum (strain 114-2 / CGMCC 5302) TaxID=933388 RepID=S7ZB67_PENO1|nr:hypothetical protein POX_c04291 [Penicillium oxalicum]EPS25916.1 hypothetical protein PDE_00852 [Penicillium oxalicum 114-2]KAI2791430.1 hypothetical protein POX_c04291 [Penicillium oxalicum]